MADSPAPRQPPFLPESPEHDSADIVRLRAALKIREWPKLKVIEAQSSGIRSLNWHPLDQLRKLHEQKRSCATRGKR